MTTRNAAIAAILILAIAIVAELAMGRAPICACGTVDLWVSARDGPKTSQMVADWYSLSHAVHGFLFYAALWLVACRLAVQWRFLAALALEAGWEVFENSAYVIARYRATTAAAGYSGDSILNSMSDILFMAGGFLIARRLPVWTSVALVIVLELIPLYAIRDNLTLNIWMFLSPNASVEAWQAAG